MNWTIFLSVTAVALLAGFWVGIRFTFYTLDKQKEEQKTRRSAEEKEYANELEQRSLRENHAKLMGSVAILRNIVAHNNESRIKREELLISEAEVRFAAAIDSLRVETREEFIKARIATREYVDLEIAKASEMTRTSIDLLKVRVEEQDINCRSRHDST